MKTKCLQCFKALSDETRFLLFSYLLSTPGGRNVSQLSSYVKLSQPTITHHLQKLTNSGLINKNKIGREVIVTYREKCQGCGLFNNNPNY